MELNSPHLAAQQQQQQQQQQQHEQHQVASPAQITTASTPTNPAISKQHIAFTTTSSTKTVPASAVQQQSLVQLIPQGDSSGQPLYFIQSTPTPTMIPLQFPQNAIPMQQLGATPQAATPQGNVISTIPVANNNQPITIAAVANQNNTQADTNTTRSIIPAGYKVKVEGASNTPNMEFVAEPQFSHTGRMTNQSPFRIHSANNYAVGGKDKSEAGPLPRPRMVRSYLDIEGMIGMQQL